MQDNTYLAVEKYNAASKSWTTVLRDNDWETEFEWIRTNTILGKYFLLRILNDLFYAIVKYCNTFINVLVQLEDQSDYFPNMISDF